MKNIRKLLFKLLTGVDVGDLVINNNVMNPTSSDNGLSDNYLFDFKNYGSQYNQNSAVPVLFTDGTSVEQTPSKIKVKPIDVLHELETIPTPFTLTLLNEKIEMLKEKESLIVQCYAKREVKGLLERLENRKRYSEFKDFFDGFQNTNDEKIDVLLNKYDLVMRVSDIFVPEFPDEAISAMKKYTEKMVELCGKRTLFYVIATADNFQDKYKQRDPILLAQSPFGFYWQILGAWDKEMLLLSEL